MSEQEKYREQAITVAETIMEEEASALSSGDPYTRNTATRNAIARAWLLGRVEGISETVEALR